MKRGCDPLTVKIKDRTFGSSYMDGLVQKTPDLFRPSVFLALKKSGLTG